MNATTLYGITAELNGILAQLEELGGEITPELEQALAINEEQFVAKAEDYGHAILNLKGMAAAAKAEKERKAEERRQRNDELREERAARARKNDSVLGRVQNTAISTVTREVTKTLTRGIMGIFKKN